MTALKLDWRRKIKLRLDSIPLTLTTGPAQKLVFKGSLYAEFPKGSYKYEPELVVSMWSPVYPKLEWRAKNNGFARAELCLPICAATRDWFMECAFEVDKLLKGSAYEG